LTANFNDFAFVLGMTVFDEVGLKSEQVGQARTGGAMPRNTS